MKTRVVAFSVAENAAARRLQLQFNLATHTSTTTSLRKLSLHKLTTQVRAPSDSYATETQSPNTGAKDRHGAPPPKTTKPSPQRAAAAWTG